jgi:Putative transposase of IS4/5 family (DUF4096)
MGTLEAFDAELSNETCADDRKIMNAIFHVLRTGMPWRELPERYGTYTTDCNRFNRRSAPVVGVLGGNSITISMNGKAAWADNLFVGDYMAPDESCLPPPPP